MTFQKEIKDIALKLVFAALAWLAVYIILFIIKGMLIQSLTPFLGQENAQKLIWALFLSPSQLIFEQYGIGIYSLIIVGLFYFSQRE